MAKTNHFSTLGVRLGASEDEIKKAYRTLAKKWHPDKNSAPGAKEKFQEIAGAYEYLSSKDRREMHERELRRAAAPPPQPQPQPQTQPPRPPPAASSKPSQPSQPNQQRPKTPGTKSTGKTPSTDKGKSTSSNAKKPNAASWSETFTKNFRQQQQAGGAGRQNGRKFYFSAEAGPGRAGFSFTYENKRAPNGSSPSQADNIFTELFSDIFNAMGFAGQTSHSGSSNQAPNKKPRPRNVAPERGNAAEDLDEEYLFTPKNRGGNDSGEELPCPWCGQKFTRGKLGQHEEKCGKFGLSGDEDDDGLSDNDYDDDDDDGLYGSSLYQPYTTHLGPGRQPNWQQQRDDFLHQVRRDKLRHRDRMASQGTRNSGYIKCPYCERSFNQVTAVKHMPWCKEHLRTYGRPMNPKYSSSTGQKTQDKDSPRQRGREYAKTVPKPSTRIVDSDESFNEEDFDFSSKKTPKDGNERKFSYSRPRMSKEDEFEIHGARFGTSEHDETVYANPTPRSRGSTQGSMPSTPGTSSSTKQGQSRSSSDKTRGSNKATSYGARGGYSRTRGGHQSSGSSFRPQKY
ncbi:uncharacterized protein LOC101856627 [Aplysia californica]|uniref:DnaJ homolog subfamily B member 9 n=1 Tax=Aplysia californica TaxID=6500 RepID=A0ABM0KA81_APLCA|nr:uncharacterized protein LOC101856627 [Aplysia californica]